MRHVSSFSVLATWIVCGFPWTFPAEGSRILAVETIGGRSHWNFMSAVLRALTEAGHHVTAFTPFSDGDRENYEEVDTSGEIPVEEYNVLEVLNKSLGAVTVFYDWTAFEKNHCDRIYSNRRLGRIMSAADKSEHYGYDVIIMEPYTLDCMSYLADTLNLPIIYAIPSPMLTQAERKFTGHVSNPSCVAHLLARHAVPKTFVQRFANAALLIQGALTTTCHEFLLRLFDPKPYHLSPAVSPSVIFLNSHYVVEASGKPVPPNLVDVGGIHLKPPGKIPKNILDFIENSSHGVIYMSFGSRIKLNEFPEHVHEAFRDAMSKVPQRVLWKYESEMKNKPKNVMTKKWFPQRDILLHPKVKLFISHGGISGVYETLDAGVPLLGFPLFYDQPRNVEHLVDRKMAISLNLLTVTVETLLNAINEIIKNDTYARNAKIASDLFKDRPMTPEQLVVYWTEYVIRHKGAHHLKSFALNLTWYQYLLLDIIAMVIFSIFLLVVVVHTSFKVIRDYTRKNNLHSDKIKTQ